MVPSGHLGHKQWLTIPPSFYDPLADVNKRISKNKTRQRSFYEALVDKDLEKDALLAMEEVEEEHAHNKSFHAKLRRKLKRTFTSSAAVMEQQTDYGISALSAEEYLVLRMVAMNAEMSAKTPGLTTRSTGYTSLAIALSVFTSALSAFDLNVFIPAALALAMAITSWGNCNQVDLRLSSTNSCGGRALPSSRKGCPITRTGWSLPRSRSYRCRLRC
jgi:hypothetical protein